MIPVGESPTCHLGTGLAYTSKWTDRTAVLINWEVIVKVLRLPDVQQRVGLSRASSWRLERQGLFPSRRQLSENAVGWIDDEADKWVRERGAVVPFKDDRRS